METVEIDQGILERLYAVIEEELGVDPRAVDPEKNFIFELGLDSVQLIRLGLGIDSEFGISLPNIAVDGLTFNGFLKSFAHEIIAAKAAQSLG